MKKLTLSPYWERVAITFVSFGFFLGFASIVFLLLDVIQHGVSLAALVGWIERVGEVVLMLLVFSLFDALYERIFQRKKQSND